MLITVPHVCWATPVNSHRLSSAPIIFKPVQSFEERVDESFTRLLSGPYQLSRILILVWPRERESNKTIIQIYPLNSHTLVCFAHVQFEVWVKPSFHDRKRFGCPNRSPQMLGQLRWSGRLPVSNWSSQPPDLVKTHARPTEKLLSRTKYTVHSGTDLNLFGRPKLFRSSECGFNMIFSDRSWSSPSPHRTRGTDTAEPL